MSDVERVIEFGKFLEEHPKAEAALVGFFCGVAYMILVILIVWWGMRGGDD